MPTNLHRLVRARMADTGESYQTALRRIREPAPATASVATPGDRFDVYVTADVFMNMPRSEQPYCMENEAPLSGQEAVALLERCTKRVGVGRVFVVCRRDDTVSFDWTRAGGVIFPPRRDR